MSYEVKTRKKLEDQRSTIHMDAKKYAQRGVSANKSEVHQAIKNLDKGLFPSSFCKVLPDILACSPDHCCIMHADTAGTKTSLAYLYWRETGDISVWKGVVQDAIIMNLDDMACVGCVDQIIVSSTIGRNKTHIPGEVLQEIITGTQNYLDSFKQFGINLSLAGGETADVGDIVRTIDVGITAFGRMKREDVITIDPRPGDLIVGLASYGQATYESEYNGGMGSNGLTSARHDVFSKSYAEKYPESFDPNLDPSVVYCGSKKLDDRMYIDGFGEITIGKLVLSPTRTYLPILKEMLPSLRNHIHGIVHCSGGGQTKVMKFVDQPLHIIKDDLLALPPLFKMIQEESGSTMEEMFQVFNMGHRLEIFVDSQESAERLIAISESYGVQAKVIGRVEESSDSKKLSIKHEGIWYEF